MKMIHDVDRYYGSSFEKKAMPAWMKAERLDFCDCTGNDRHANWFQSIVRFFC